MVTTPVVMLTSINSWEPSPVAYKFWDQAAGVMKRVTATIGAATRRNMRMSRSPGTFFRFSIVERVRPDEHGRTVGGLSEIGRRSQISRLPKTANLRFPRGFAGET
jgi:hypothetical protein